MKLFRKDEQEEEQLTLEDCELLEKLDLKAQKLRQRKDEAKAHQRNVRTGKK